ncbi:MAG: hypothetical protein AVDCRST_MAG67-2914, partial [uncultured Solirubrobacteraceae bacterium]
ERADRDRRGGGPSAGPPGSRAAVASSWISDARLGRQRAAGNAHDPGPQADRGARRHRPRRRQRHRPRQGPVAGGLGDRVCPVHRLARRRADRRGGRQRRAYPGPEVVADRASRRGHSRERRGTHLRRSARGEDARPVRRRRRSQDLQARSAGPRDAVTGPHDRAGRTGSVSVAGDRPDARPQRHAQARRARPPSCRHPRTRPRRDRAARHSRLPV